MKIQILQRGSDYLVRFRRSWCPVWFYFVWDGIWFWPDIWTWTSLEHAQEQVGNIVRDYKDRTTKKRTPVTIYSTQYL